MSDLVVEDKDLMPLRDAAQWALDCQNAVNLSGVVHTFSRVLHNALWPEARRLNAGTEWVNRHPIVTLFLSKLCDLNRIYDEMSTFDKAFEECMRLAERR